MTKTEHLKKAAKEFTLDVNRILYG